MSVCVVPLPSSLSFRRLRDRNGGDPSPVFADKGPYPSGSKSVETRDDPSTRPPLRPDSWVRSRSTPSPTARRESHLCLINTYVYRACVHVFVFVSSSSAYSTLGVKGPPLHSAPPHDPARRAGRGVRGSRGTTLSYPRGSLRVGGGFVLLFGSTLFVL